MGRRRKQPTKMVRISTIYLAILKERARKNKMSLGDYIAKLTRRRRIWKTKEEISQDWFILW